MGIKILFISLILIGFLKNALSEEAKKVESLEDVLINDLLSPINTDARIPLSIGVVATIIIASEKHNLDEQTKQDALYDKPMGRYGYVGEVIGWGYLNGLYIAGFALHNYYTKSSRSLERSEIMAISSLFTLATTTALKLSIRRTRPEFPDKHDSFPSGHSSMAFNFASVVTAEHGIWWGIPANLLATTIAYSRVNDGRHWLSDLIAGATIGISYGLGVYLNRREKKVPFLFSALIDPENERYGLKITIN